MLKPQTADAEELGSLEEELEDAADAGGTTIEDAEVGAKETELEIMTQERGLLQAAKNRQPEWVRGMKAKSKARFTQAGSGAAGTAAQLYARGSTELERVREAGADGQGAVRDAAAAVQDRADMRAQDLGRFAEENGDVAEALAELSNETAKVGAAIPEEGLDRRYDLGALVFNSTGAALRRAASATSRAAEFSGRVTDKE